MDSRNTLLFRKGTGPVVNSYTRWSIGCCKVPFNVGGKTKDVAKRSWHDEHGEDSYIPSSLMFDAYDAEFELACVVNGDGMSMSKAFEKIDSFKKWLSGNEDGGGAELKIYSPYSGIGRQGCYLLDINNEEPCLQLKQSRGNIYHENVLTFRVSFRITDPMTNITLY